MALIVAIEVREYEGLRAQYGKSIHDPAWRAQPENKEARIAFEKVEQTPYGFELLEIAQRLRQISSHRSSLLDVLEKIKQNPEILK